MYGNRDFHKYGWLQNKNKTFTRPDNVWLGNNITEKYKHENTEDVKKSRESRE